ncbi:MAG: FprA family A-type flavoprotein [Clostridiales bacterium]|nr:FprA family A-type flavoprotein [Clostridiales bacterium]
MYNVRKLTDDLTWIGGTDRKITRFENVYKLNSGMNYNSYFLDSGATVLFDTVGRESEEIFFENLRYCLNGRKLDYVVIHHMEPDHSATLASVLDMNSEAKIVVNAKTLQFISQFFPDMDYSARAVTVKDGDEMMLGDHKFKFVFAPMVHWPEVMFSFDETEGTLFSADAFGSYGAVNGSVFADGKDFDRDLLNEARRYYTNIVGKYGMQTVAAINKVGSLDIRMICPLHSYVWRRDMEKIINCYRMWGSYTPEVKGVFILAGSIYGHTANAAEVLMTELDKRGIDSVILDASVTDISDIIAMAFKYSHIVIASATYNNSVYSPVEHAVSELAAHGLAGRSFSVIENGTWAPSAAKGVNAVIEKMKDCRVTGQTVTVKSSGNDAVRAAIEALADAIENDMRE